MKEFPIPLIELKEAIEKGKYIGKYNSCRVNNVGHFHYIESRFLAGKTEYWIYNDQTGDYYEDTTTMIPIEEED